MIMNDLWKEFTPNTSKLRRDILETWNWLFFVREFVKIWNTVRGSRIRENNSSWICGLRYICDSWFVNRQNRVREIVKPIISPSFVSSWKRKKSFVNSLSEPLRGLSKRDRRRVSNFQISLFSSCVLGGLPHIVVRGHATKKSPILDQLIRIFRSIFRKKKTLHGVLGVFSMICDTNPKV